jgi:multiple sugar transport system substrate-binding protein
MDLSMTRRGFLAQSGKVALAAGVGGSLLEACGGGSAPSGPTTISFGWWSNTPAKDTAMKAWVNDFEKANPTIKVKFEIISWANYWDKLKTTTAGGNAYDVIGLASSMAGAYYQEGALTDLTTFSDYTDASNIVSPASLQLGKWSGKSYSLPIGTSVSLLGYSKKLLKDAGVDYPSSTEPMTFDQFKAMAQKLSIKKNGQYTQYAINPLNILTYDTFARMNGGSTYDNPVNPTKITINSPAGIQGLTDYMSLFTDHLSPSYDSLTTGPWSYDIGALQTGKIAFARVGAWLFSDMAANPDYAVAPIFKKQSFVTIGTVNSLAIYKGSKNQDQAWKFVKWATQTQPEISFAKFSDVPSNKDAFSQLNTYITPASYIPALQTAFPSFQPDLISSKSDQVTAALGDVITDMAGGKLTPTQAAAQMESKGNAILSSAS